MNGAAGARSALRLRPPLPEARTVTLPSPGQGRGDIKLPHHERANPDRLWNVILSEAKLQRRGRSPRGQAFNLGAIPG